MIIKYENQNVIWKMKKIVLGYLINWHDAKSVQLWEVTKSVTKVQLSEVTFVKWCKECTTWEVKKKKKHFLHLAINRSQ